ncbi:hypothetical protein A2244_04935 [Candidatus Peregrinibacteria bacterium RIFOXYA2_FULL_41_18]|nr:MAG: hypothetical protein A2244_04935 [Candidatus Peregrinibacteria bacterium RIFOXYA2_FULL_41_18]
MTKQPKKIDFAVGGQAVMEGVMMRSPRFYAVAVRKDDGRIRVHEKEFTSLTKRFSLFGLPILRGLIHLFESMYIGLNALQISNSEFIAGDKDHTINKKALWREILEAVFAFLYLILVFGFAIFLFKFLPLWITNFASSKWIFLDDHFWAFNMLDGLVKMSFFLVYLLLISLIPDIKRVFEYHGAEHKSIWTYELEQTLIPANAKKQTRFHPRCGTSFILLVILISIAIYTAIPRPDGGFLIMFAQRVAFLPLIAGISYEALKLSAKHMDSAFVRAITAPGLWLQKITTREPDEKQLEVAICALEKCLELEGKEQDTRHRQQRDCKWRRPTTTYA